MSEQKKLAEVPANAINFFGEGGQLLGRLFWVNGVIHFEGNMDLSAQVFFEFVQTNKLDPIIADYAEMEKGARAVLAENMRLRDELSRANGDEIVEPEVPQAAPIAFVDFDSSEKEVKYTVMDVIDHVRSRGFNSPLLVEIEAWWKSQG